MLRIAIIDDDRLYAIDLELLLVSLKYSVVNVAVTTVPAMMELIRQEAPDLVLANVFVGGRPMGLLLTNELTSQGIATILYTDQDQPGVFDLAQRMKPYAYLVRPFDGLTLDRAIKLALIHHKKQAEDKQLFPFQAKNAKGDLVRSDLYEVTAIEAVGNYCYFHSQGEKLAVRSSLVKLIETLPEGMFLRTHRRYLVAARLIRRINTAKSKVYAGEEEFPLGGKYSKDVMLFMQGGRE